VVLAAKPIHGTAAKANASKSDFIVEFLSSVRAPCSGARAVNVVWLAQPNGGTPFLARNKTLPIVPEGQLEDKVRFFVIDDRIYRCIAQPLTAPKTVSKVLTAIVYQE
jgi:hypothetical protein